MLDTVDALADRLLDAFDYWGGPDGFALRRAVRRAGRLRAVRRRAQIYATERIGAAPADVAAALRRAAVRRGMAPPEASLMHTKARPSAVHAENAAAGSPAPPMVH